MIPEKHFLLKHHQKINPYTLQFAIFIFLCSFSQLCIGFRIKQDVPVSMSMQSDCISFPAVVALCKLSRHLQHPCNRAQQPYPTTTHPTLSFFHFQFSHIFCSSYFSMQAKYSTIKCRQRDENISCHKSYMLHFLILFSFIFTLQSYSCITPPLP